MTTVLYSLGMGADSCAGLAALLTRPELRDFDLADLVCLTAQTGNEYQVTEHLMNTYMLPLLREYGIRYVQVCRAGQSDRDGYVVLSDSRSTQKMTMRGPWSLADDLTRGGTVPQLASKNCSRKAKGKVMDAWAADNIGTGYVHMIGYSAEEGYRITRDQGYTTNGRRPRYPLAEWGWTRDVAFGWLHELFGVTWSRSCCVYCPFQASKKGIPELVARWRAEPAAAAQALIIEHRALALNGNAAMFGGTKTARSIAVDHDMTEALATATAELLDAPWALYDVRRILFPKNGDPKAKGQVWRSVTTLATGHHDAMADELARAAAYADTPLTRDLHGVDRAWILRSEPPYPAVQRQLTIGPTGVDDKQRPGFTKRWNRYAPPGHRSKEIRPLPGAHPGLMWRLSEPPRVVANSSPAP